MANAAPTKPLIFADDPYESLDEGLAFKTGDHDLSYVPGYSEKKRENAFRARDDEPLHELPRLQWVRISRGSGEDVGVTDDAMMTWRAQGYMAMGTDKLRELAEQYWPEYGYRFPPQARVAADGTIRRSGDVALFYVPPTRAAENRLAEAEKRANQAPRRLEPEDEGLELYENKRSVQKQTSPRQVMESDA